MWFALISGPAAAEGASRDLQLAVFINDAPTNLVASFTQASDGHLSTKRRELTEIGVKPPGRGGEEDLVAIGPNAGLPYRLDEPGQRIFFTLGDDRRIPKQYDLRGAITDTPLAQPDLGGVLNYLVFGSATRGQSDRLVTFSGANATLDARIFGPLGQISQSGIVGMTAARQSNILRLDTTYSYSNPKTQTTLRLGDVISNGLPWTRPVRLGGGQFQKDFALRPDLVTAPLPSVTGSAAVPSTLDLYVNNVKTFSQNVAAGPYQIANIPVVSTSGTAQIVLRDAAGRQVQTTAAFYTSPRLLREGFTDYAIEAGAPRLRYAIDSDRYDPAPVASFTLRRGIFDWLTFEAHGEGGRALQNAGAGLVANIGARGVVSLAAAGNQSGNGRGGQIYAAFDTRLFAVLLHASVQRTLREYDDIASIAGARSLAALQMQGAPSATMLTGLYSVRPQKAVDSLTLGLPLADYRAQASIGYIHLKPYRGASSHLVTGSISKSLLASANFSLTGSYDLVSRSTNVFASFSMPLDLPRLGLTQTNVSTGVMRSGQGIAGFAEASRNASMEPGSFGWRVRDAEGAAHNRLASGTYRSAIGTLDATVQQVGGAGYGLVQAQGAIAAMGGGVFATNRIDDAFAVVDAGAPNVNVLYENRPAGVTNAKGLALIPTMRAFQPNRIDIDTRNLPVNAEAETTRNVIAPSNRGGVLVRFGVQSDPRAAIVILLNGAGVPLPAGSTGRLENGGAEFVVGHGGEAFIRGLQPHNVALVTTDAGECRAEFAYAPRQDTQVRIGPTPCR